MASHLSFIWRHAVQAFDDLVRLPSGTSADVFGDIIHLVSS
jgi:hypothetical protein